MDSEQVRTLFNQSLQGDGDCEQAWAAVQAPRVEASREVFEHATGWCRSGDPLKRARAADILCQLRPQRRPGMTDAPREVFREGAYELITNMLGAEEDPRVLRSVVHALGHLDNPRAIPMMAVRALTGLTMDPSSDVRDWAFFGLGVQGDADSTEIREALLRCLNDTDADVREEAVVGLAKRQDPRVIPTLRAMLDKPGFSDRVQEAVAALLDPDPAPKEWTAADYKAAFNERLRPPGGRRRFGGGA